MKYNTDFLSSETNPAVTSCFADTVSRPVPHASSLPASGFLALWLRRRSSSAAPSAFLSSSAIGCGLLPLFSPKSFILSRAICFLSFLYGLAEVCTEGLALLSPCLLRGLMENSSSGFCLAYLAGGSPLLAHLPGLAQLGCGALPHQPFCICSLVKQKVLVKVCRSLLLCCLFCVFLAR